MLQDAYLLVSTSTSSYSSSCAELYDFHSKNTIETQHTFTDNFSIFKSQLDNSLIFSNSKKKSNNISRVLIDQNEPYYISDFTSLKNCSDFSYLVVRRINPETRKNQLYEINQGDIIKIGRLKLKVREICIKNRNKLNTKFDEILNIKANKKASSKNNIINNNKINMNSPHNNNKNIIYENKNNAQNVQTSKKICRICYCTEQEENSPLINPCKCSGGVKYIHLSCLKQWIKSRMDLNIKSESKNCVLLSFKLVYCEICKEIFPDFIIDYYHKKVYDVYNYREITHSNTFINETNANNDINIYSSNSFEHGHEKFHSYIKLESMTGNDEVKRFYILSLDNRKTISIGRSSGNEIKYNDTSISRFHCVIKLVGDKIYLKDKQSKYGTSILIQNSKLNIKYTFPLVIQVNNSIVRFRRIRKCSLFNCLYLTFCSCFEGSRINNKEIVFKTYGQNNQSDADKAFTIKYNDNFDIDNDSEEYFNSNMNHNNKNHNLEEEDERNQKNLYNDNIDTANNLNTSKKFDIEDGEMCIKLSKISRLKEMTTTIGKNNDVEIEMEDEDNENEEPGESRKEENKKGIMSDNHILNIPFNLRITRGGSNICGGELNDEEINNQGHERDDFFILNCNSNNSNTIDKD